MSEQSKSNKLLIATNIGWRVSQACDRCRQKKIKCDGAKPCGGCSAIGFECTTSDKLSRRAFPKGYTVNLEKRVKELEDENIALKEQIRHGLGSVASSTQMMVAPEREPRQEESEKSVAMTNQKHTIQINNPIDQIFNLDKKGIVIGNDNLNFESQFNRLLINLNLPFLKITNSHNYLLNDPDSYLFHPSYSSFNEFHNKDLEIIYNPLTVHGHTGVAADGTMVNNELPRDVYDLFIKLINNFKKIFNSKKELDSQVAQYFLNYNTFIPIFDYKSFMDSYDSFHTMYPFMFTYDDATINGFNISTNDYHVVNEHLMTVIQVYAMVFMNDPSLNLNLLLNHLYPNYAIKFKKEKDSELIIRSLYDFLPYLNAFYVSMAQLQTYLLFFYYSLLTNNKEKSLMLSALINAYIGILGINLNSNNLFFNDLSLSIQQRRDRVKLFWGFKVLLKCFNLKFGFKPSINTTVINPVTIDRYFKLTPEKLSTLLDVSPNLSLDLLFQTLLKPSVEFLNLMNIIIPSSFSPNYYQYLKQDRNGESPQKKPPHPSNLDWILNDDDGDGNDGNLNYNYAQFLTIDKNLSNWRYSLKEKTLNLIPLSQVMRLPALSSVQDTSLYHRITFDGENPLVNGLTDEGLLNFANTGVIDTNTAAQLVRIQLNFHYLLIRSNNYINFVIDRELTHNYYVKIANISRELLAYFLLVFEHVGKAEIALQANLYDGEEFFDSRRIAAGSALSPEIGIDVDEDGFVINDFSVKRRKVQANNPVKKTARVLPMSPFNAMLNGLSLTIVNLKKLIVLQMLYLLICSLKIAKKGGVMSNDTVRTLNRSISLFIRIFINYQPNVNKFMKTKKVKEDDLFKRIINDELKDEFLKDNKEDSDEEDGDNEIDWDDEDLDEDLKYLKTLKYIKYKTNMLYERSQAKRQMQMDIKDPIRKSQTPGLNPMPLPPLGPSPSYTPTPMSSKLFPETSAARPYYEENAEVKKEKLATELINLRNGSWYGQKQ